MTSNKFIKWLLIFAGSLFVGLAIIGIFLPLLPTTPFLLLAAACYVRSSERFHKRLLNNKWFGIYIRNYYKGNGIPRKVKIISTTLLWLTISFSIVFVVKNIFIRILLAIIAIAVTIHILSIRKKNNPANK